MPQILDYFIEPLYGQVCLSDRDAVLSASPSGDLVISEPSWVAVAVGDEADQLVEIEVYTGTDEHPRLQNLEPIFDGELILANHGMRLFAPTGEEIVLNEISAGRHRLALFRDGYPTTRFVVVIDGV